MRKQRKIAIESLSIAFGKDKSAQERRDIAKRCFSYMAKSALEVLFLTARHKLLKQRIKIVGKNNLDAALSEGKGVILVSAHFGNFPLTLCKLCLEGYKVNVIMRHMRDARAEKIILEKGKGLDLKIIFSQPRKECVGSVIKALRENEIVFLLIDQNFGNSGVFVDFFGRKAATATGPVIFAQRTKANILPCFIIRQKDDTHKIIFEPALRLEDDLAAQKTISINIQRITNIIESYIRKYPAEWGWIHRRWKSQMKT